MQIETINDHGCKRVTVSISEVDSYTPLGGYAPYSFDNIIATHWTILSKTVGSVTKYVEIQQSYTTTDFAGGGKYDSTWYVKDKDGAILCDPLPFYKVVNIALCILDIACTDNAIRRYQIVE